MGKPNPKKAIDEQQASSSSSVKGNGISPETTGDGPRRSGRKRKAPGDNASQADDHGEQNGRSAPTQPKPTAAAPARKSQRVASDKDGFARRRMIDPIDLSWLPSVEEVLNDGVFPTKEIQFKEFDLLVQEIFEIQQRLGLSQPDKAKWDNALYQIISLRSVYNERLRTGIEVPETTTDKAVQTFREVASAGTQVKFEVPELETVVLQTVGRPNEPEKKDKATSTSDLIIGNDDNQRNPVAIGDSSESAKKNAETKDVNGHEDYEPETNPVYSATTESAAEPSPLFTEALVEGAKSMTERNLVTFCNSLGDQERSENNLSNRPSSPGTSFSNSEMPNERLENGSDSWDNQGDGVGCDEGVIEAEVNEAYTDKPGTEPEKPTPNDLNGDDETLSTSSNSRLPDASINSDDSSSDGGHMLPNVPTYYKERKLRVFKGRGRCLKEDQFLTNINENVANPVIAIRGPSYMGKTTFLAQMGRKILRAFPGRKLFYLEMKKVVDAVKEKRMNAYKDKATWAALQGLTKEDELGKARPNPKSPVKINTELFFDSFDNVELCDCGLVSEILRCVSLSFHSTGIRSWIATVPNDFRVKEVLQKADSYLLEPLDQAELLVSYLELHTTKDRPKLFKFVKGCVKDLTLNHKVHLKLESPLQCILIGAACLGEKISDSQKFLLVKPKNILYINDSEIHENLLLDAASKRSFHTLKIILGLNKFDINCLDMYNETPALLSIREKGNVDCIEKFFILEQRGASTDLSETQYVNLLNYAARCSSFETFCDIYHFFNLVNLTFDIDCVDVHGNTPLFNAIVDGVGSIDCLKKFKFLEQNGAKLDHVNKYDTNLLQFAARSGSLESLKYIANLNDFSNIDCVDDDGDTPLFHAAYADDNFDSLSKVKFLIEEKDADVNHLNKLNQNLLLFAATHGKADVLEHVINMNIFNMEDEDVEGDTPLLSCVLKSEDNDCLEKLELLKNKNLNWDHVNKKGSNILHYAALYASVKVLKYVISMEEIDLNSVDNDGYTALDYAKADDDKKSMNAKVKLLNEKGCVSKG